MKRRFVLAAPFAALALLALPSAAQIAPGRTPMPAEPVAPQPEPEPTHETVPVAIETTMGTIVVAVETERAPITAGNFLKYADEGRLDGTRFYRTMRLAWGDQTAGLIQGGAQNHPDRVLAPIAHEPTTVTGLSHVEGAISAARFEPGTATGDFSIMATDMTGLDAQPDADDLDQQAGYAVFGIVTEGLDVVKAIHAAPTDPDKGEGFLKGQILAEPVTIISVKRLTAK